MNRKKKERMTAEKVKTTREKQYKTEDCRRKRRLREVGRVCKESKCAVGRKENSRKKERPREECKTEGRKENRKTRNKVRKIRLRDKIK
jgi:hypothetical protein